jgi:hypothetical protein
MADNLILRSTIHADLRRYTLLKGSILALFGIFMILISGIFLPKEILDLWGLPVFVIGMGFITWGLLPYRQLSRLESRPNELHLTPSQDLDYIEQGQVALRIPLKAVKKWIHSETDQLYGIGVVLNHGMENSVIMYQNLHQSATHPTILKEFNVNFFFPYFSKRSYDELVEVVGIVEPQEE